MALVFGCNRSNTLSLRTTWSFDAFPPKLCFASIIFGIPESLITQFVTALIATNNFYTKVTFDTRGMGTIYIPLIIPISTEGSGTPTTRPKFGSLV